MEEKNVYLFLGRPSEDIIIYLANILQNLKISVLVLDATKSQVLLKCIPKPPNQPEPINYRGVDYIGFGTLMFDKKISKEDLKKYLNHYEIILVSTDLRSYKGIDVEDTKKESILTSSMELNDRVKEIYIVTNLYKHNIEKVSHFIGIQSLEVTVILRDICDSKLDMEYYLNTYFEKFEFSVKRYQLPLDEVDYDYRIRLEYEAVHEFKKISKEFVQVLISIIRDMKEVEEKKLNKALQNAKKGEVYEGSVL